MSKGPSYTTKVKRLRPFGLKNSGKNRKPNQQKQFDRLSLHEKISVVLQTTDK